MAQTQVKPEGYIFPDCKRLGFVPIFAHSDTLQCVTVLAAVTCHGIFGSGDKIQTTQNTQIGASEDAVQSTGGGAASREGDAIKADSSNVALGGSIAVGGGSTLQTGGARVGGNNSGTITVGYDAGTTQTLLQTVGNNLSEALNAQSAAGRSTLDSILNSIGRLAESKQTDGQSGQNKTVLWFGLGVLVLLWFLNRK